MNIRVINNISDGTLRLILNKIRDRELIEDLAKNKISAVGLFQANVADIIYASDIAEKASSVITCEISGCCPQHMICLGIFGTLADVTSAVNSIREGLH